MNEDTKRRSPRIATRLEGILAGRSRRDVTVLDLSAGGCLVQCGSLVDPGAIQDLCLPIGDQAFEVKVRVTEASLDGAASSEAPRYLLGLEFLGLPPQLETRLLTFLQERQRRRGAALS